MKKSRDNLQGNITISFIKHLHELIINNIDIESAGVFRRTDDIRIADSDIIPTPSMIIKTDLEDRIQNFYGKIVGNFYPFEQIILFHYQFKIIHPFIDGNGRVGREILNYLLSQYGYPKFYYPNTQRERYIRALISGNNEKFSEILREFSALLYDQYHDAVQSNLEKVVTPVKEKTQKRLGDFFSV